MDKLDSDPTNMPGSGSAILVKTGSGSDQYARILSEYLAGGAWLISAVNPMEPRRPPKQNS